MKRHGWVTLGVGGCLMACRYLPILVDSITYLTSSLLRSDPFLLANITILPRIVYSTAIVSTLRIMFKWDSKSMWHSLQSLIPSRNSSENATASPKTSILCNKCQSISFQKNNNEEFYRRSVALNRYFYQHHSSLNQLEASARGGCEFCALLFYGLVTCDTTRSPAELARSRDRWSKSPVFLTPVLGGKETYTPGMELRAECWDGTFRRDAVFVLVNLSGP